MSFVNIRFVFSSIVIASVFLPSASSVKAWQPVTPAIQLAVPMDEAKPEVPSQDEVQEDAKKEEVEEITPRVQPVVDEHIIQLEMWDGSIISGQIRIDSIPVLTQFGRLEVPIGQVRRILPGLDSYPEMKSKIDGLVAALSDKDFDARDQAQQQIAKMGVLLRKQFEQWQREGNAEQKKRLKEITDELIPMVDELQANGELDAERSLIYKDTVVTEEFTIVGKIEAVDFILETKFGDLNITLADIKTADRAIFMRGADVRKTVKVDGESFFQREPTNTRIQVQRGDVIQIRAGGSVNWTNWNQSSSPEGLNGQGNYQGFTSGTLIARIGTTGKFIKIGDKAEFKATSNGTLYLGIAMQDNYVNQGNSYHWTGNYDASIVVKPQ